MLKTIMMNVTNIVALASSGNDFMIVVTNLLMLGEAFMLLNGRRTLKILRLLRFTLFATKSINLGKVSLAFNFYSLN